MIYLIRHGQSIFNSCGLMTYDTKLTDLGKAQANSIKLEVDLVVCSPMTRTIETLNNSNIKYKNIIYSSNAREHLNNNLINYFDKEDLVEESMEDFRLRISNLKKELKELESLYNVIAVITHHGVIKELTDIYVNNCQIVVLK